MRYYCDIQTQKSRHYKTKSNASSLFEIFSGINLLTKIVQMFACFQSDPGIKHDTNNVTAHLYAVQFELYIIFDSQKLFIILYFNLVNYFNNNSAKASFRSS